MSKSIQIAPSAKVYDVNRLYGDDFRIKKYAVVGPDIAFGAGVTIGEYSNVDGASYIGNGVKIGSHVDIAKFALLLDRVVICPNNVRSESSNARYLERRCSIGPGVLLHDEVELGEGAIVPAQGTIASLGHFGAKNRVVTIYGSDVGPLYSVGCQMGIDIQTLGTRVAKNTGTSTASANTYAPFLRSFQEIGCVVQAAYDREAVMVAEIKEMRLDLALD